MALINILLAAAFGVNLVAAQMQCNGYRLPAYDDCTLLPHPRAYLPGSDDHSAHAFYCLLTK